MQNAYAEALDALLEDTCQPATVRAIESGADRRPLWQHLHDSGFVDGMLPEADGGGALTLAEVCPMLFTLGRHAMPLPVAQTMFARTLLHAQRLPLPAEPVALASFDDGAPSALVADGAGAAWFLVQDDTQCRLLPASQAQTEATGAHADLTVRLHRPKPDASDAFALPAGALRHIGARLHAAQLAGAMSRVLDLTLRYANDRAQFGRAIGKFQAIQQQVSEMAEHVAAAVVAAQLACAGGGTHPDPWRVAIGKLRTSDAVTPVAAIAHAVHGAIGITEEYTLQLYTRRLHAWRMADGSERWWARVLGEDVLTRRDAGAVEIVRTWCEA